MAMLRSQILADQYALGGFHSHLDPSLLRWEHRRPRIVQQIEALDADVLALQEVACLAGDRGSESWSDWQQQCAPWATGAGAAAHPLPLLLPPPGRSPAG